MKVIIDEKGNRYFWRKGDFTCTFGMIKEADIKNGVAESNIKKKFIIFDGTFADELDNLKRGPALMNKKDIGLIISYAGVGLKSKVVDAGVGCGALASSLARIGCDVVSYEIKEEHADVARKNFERTGMKVELKVKDIYEGIDEKNLDLITLDLLEPRKVLKHAYNSLKSGGFLVCYVTNVSQIMEMVGAVEGNEFFIERIIENIEREWDVNSIRARPSSSGIMHTGFLVFLRRI